MAGTLFVVATPIGNLEDISARALRVLREVALIAAEDTRRTAKLLARHGITTHTISLHAHNERQKVGDVLARLQRGEGVALVSDAGTPTISDPGAPLIAAAAAAGLRVEPIPGPSAVMTILSASGFELDGFTFLGFPPNRQTERRIWFERLASSAPCAVFYEAPHRIRFTLEALQRRVGDVEVVVGRELTKIHEEFFRGTVSAVLPRIGQALGEFTVAVRLGKATESLVIQELSARMATDIFGQLTKNVGLNRRQAIAKISRDYGLSARSVFALLEDGKVLVR